MARWVPHPVAPQLGSDVCQALAGSKSEQPLPPPAHAVSRDAFTVVPPTATTSGEADGYSTVSPVSPEAKTVAMPGWFHALSKLFSPENSLAPQLLDMADTPLSAA